MDVIQGVVQHYSWGDSRAIPELLGVPSDGHPWAELWLGTHPSAPSTLLDGTPLSERTGELHFLLKVLAAAEPLSLQTHPTTEQAARGFDREEAEGIPIDSPLRTYRDRNAKPELLCSLTHFETLCGFRDFDATIGWFEQQEWHELAHQLRHGAPHFLRWALTEGPKVLPPRAPAWAQRVAERHPGDGGVLVTLLMNHVVLAPGEAIYLDAGNLHAYLGGVGVEVMGSSDNVVRGGLTTKHVDIDELLSVLDFTPLAHPTVEPLQVAPGRWCYPSGDAPFRLWRVEVDGTSAHVATGRELMLCTAGSVGALRRGEAMATLPGDLVRLDGEGTVFLVEEAA